MHIFGHSSICSQMKQPNSTDQCVSNACFRDMSCGPSVIQLPVYVTTALSVLFSLRALSFRSTCGCLRFYNQKDHINSLDQCRHHSCRWELTWESSYEELIGMETCLINTSLARPFSLLPTCCYVMQVTCDCLKLCRKLVLFNLLDISNDVHVSQTSGLPNVTCTR